MQKALEGRRPGGPDGPAPPAHINDDGGAADAH